MASSSGSKDNLPRIRAMHERYIVEADVIFEDGAAELTDISRAGAGLRLSLDRVTAGEVLNVSIIVGSAWFGPLVSRVVWVRKDRAGLVFIEGTDEMEIDRVIDVLRSCSDGKLRPGGSHPEGRPRQ